MSEPRIGLVLGGGGARGVSHIAVLAALDDLGLKPAAVAGSSIGAIIGAGVAAGLSADEIRERFLAAFGTRGSTLAKLWQLRPRTFAELFGKDSLGLGKLDPERVMSVFVGDAIPQSFSDLKLPFVAVATDFYAGIESHIAVGNLPQAIAASCALPGIFRPVTIDGREMIDGSILNPVPVDALSQDVDIVIAVDVVSFPEPRDDRAMPTAFEAIMGSAQLMMQQMMMPKLERRPPDLLVRPAIGNIHVMDFLKTREILEACEPLREDVKRKLSRLIEAPTTSFLALERTQLRVTGQAG